MKVLFRFLVCLPLVGCRTYGSKARYADISLGPDEALSSCTLIDPRDLNNLKPGIRVYDGYRADAETIARFRRDLASHPDEQINISIQKFEESTKVQKNVNRLLEFSSPAIKLEELKAIFIYSRMSTPFNKALRQAGERLVKFRDAVNTLASGLNALRALPQYAHDGLSLRVDFVNSMEDLNALSEKYLEGNTVIEYGFLSTAKNQSELNEYIKWRQRYHNTPYRVNYKIISSKGVNIADFSFNPGFEEILFAPGSSFVVQNKPTIQKSGNLVILNVELRDLQ